MVTFQCERCGNCCKGNMWLSKIISHSDIEKWKLQGRKDILKYVCTCGSSFIDPEQKDLPEPKRSCPFLEYREGKASCRIYEVRPQACKAFPVERLGEFEFRDEWHLHSWLWNAKCSVAAKFKKELARACGLEMETRVSNKGFW